MIYLTRRERFNAAHRLYNPEWDDKKNERIYGKCSNPNWHGHNYELFVTIKGEIKEKTGYVVNSKSLSKLIKESVIEEIDHKNINLEVIFMKGLLASTENLAVGIWEELEKIILSFGAELHRIKVRESENNYAEYFGE